MDWSLCTRFFSSLAVIALIVPPQGTPIAQGAQGRFGLRLVIVPTCHAPVDREASVAPLVADAQDAISHARVYLSTVAAAPVEYSVELRAEHDRDNIGNWLIKRVGDTQPILRINRCSGRVTPLTEG